MPLLHRTALAVALLAVAPLASAAQATDQFDVKITITNACNVTASDMTFPNTSSLASTSVTATSNVAVACSNKGVFSVAFNKGLDVSASLASRKMGNGAGSSVNYSLYRDSAHLELLGDGSSESSVTLGGTSTGNNTADNFTIYGLVPSGQGDKPTGAYSDTVTATVTF